MADRDSRGRYIKGHAASGPGRPRRATEAAYLLAMTEEVTLDDWRAITRAALERALAGDSKARAWLSGYLVGQPQTGRLVEAEADELLAADLPLDLAASRLVPIAWDTDLAEVPKRVEMAKQALLQALESDG